MSPKTPHKHSKAEADESGHPSSPSPANSKRPYQAPQITTRPLFERLALSCEHAVDPDTGELIVDGPS